MKAGLTLQQLAMELHRQNEAKQDFLVNTGSMQFETFGDQVYLQLHDNSMAPLEPLEVNSIAHQQLGTFTEVPAAYYNKMLTEHPALLAHNLNEWLHRDPAQRLVRTLFGTARAFLSNR